MEQASPQAAEAAEEPSLVVVAMAPLKQELFLESAQQEPVLVKQPQAWAMTVQQASLLLMAEALEKMAVELPQVWQMDAAAVEL